MYKYTEIYELVVNILIWIILFIYFFLYRHTVDKNKAGLI